jgi:hypothetical protein
MVFLILEGFSGHLREAIDKAMSIGGNGAADPTN